MQRNERSGAQARFAKEILHMLADMEFPLERMYSTTESGQPKWQVLESLQSNHPGARLHFVEDKLSALQLVIERENLRDVQLFLVDWGYTTAEELQWAQESERITVLASSQFANLLSPLESGSP